MRARLARFAALAAAVATASVGMAVGMASPASAEVPPVFLSPAPGGTLPGGSTGPVVIDFITPGRYDVFVECEPGYIWTASGSYAGRTSFTIDRLVDYEGRSLAGGRCETTVYDEGYSTFTSRFTVAHPTLSVGDVRPTRTTFYPLVKDGYLDATGFQFAVNRPANGSLSIATPNGKVVYSASRRLNFGGNSWPWKGTTTSGAPVRPGTYRVTVAATAGGITVRKSVGVRVATKVVTKKKRLRQSGLDSRDSTRGTCYTSFDTYEETTTLDCWGGTYAATTFTFRIPANAKNLRWGSSTARSGLDRCCHGSISKRGYRDGRTKFRIRVEATGWRSVDVYGAWVSFRTRIRL